MGEGPKNLRDDDVVGTPRTEDLRGRTDPDLLGRAGTSDLGRDVRVGSGLESNLGTTGSSISATTPTSAGTTSVNTTSSTSSDTREIRSEIEQKRQDISETIDAIQERLAPRNVMSQAAGSVKEATMERMRQVANVAGDTAGQVAGRTRDVASSVATRVRENPWPAVAVVGLGLGTWWVLSRRAGASDNWEDIDTYEYDYDEETIYTDEDLYGGSRGMMGGNALPLALVGAGLAWWAWSSRQGGNGSEIRYSYGSAGADAGSYRSFPEGGERAEEGATERVRQAVTDATDRARHVVNDATGRARTAVGDARERTRAMASRAGEQVGQARRRAVTQMQHWMETNPLAVGAAALAMGVAVGLALPETHREREMMGEARDNLVNKAQEMAGQAVDKVQEKARDVVKP